MPPSGLLRRVVLVSHRFGGTYRFYHQGDKNRRGRKNFRSMLKLLVTAKVLFLAFRFFSLCLCRRHVPPKRRFLQDPHGKTSQRRHSSKLGMLFHLACLRILIGFVYSEKWIGRLSITRLFRQIYFLCS
jgi:hypothetical protein